MSAPVKDETVKEEPQKKKGGGWGGLKGVFGSKK